MIADHSYCKSKKEQKKKNEKKIKKTLSTKRGLNSRPSAYEADATTTKLLVLCMKKY